MGLFSILHSGSTAMGAASTALQTTSNNVANAETPGYARQSVVLETGGTIRRGGLLLGQGVRASTVRASFDRFSQDRVFGRLGQQGFAAAQATDMRGIETALAEGPDGGLGQALTAFLDGFSALEASPSDPWVRLDIVSRAQELSGYFNRQAQDLTDRQHQADESLPGLAQRATTLAAQAAALNEDIVRLEASGGRANDLRARRTQVIQELSVLGPTNVKDAPDGAVTVIFAGHAIVEGGHARTVSTSVDPNTGFRQVRISQGRGTMDITSALSAGGSIGSELRTRDVTTAGLLNQLDEIAFTVANEVNRVHAMGVGLDGVSGRDFFSAPAQQQGAARALAVDPGIAANSNTIGAAGSAGTIPGGNQVAALLASISDSTLLAGGTRTIGQSYAALLGGLGTEASTAYAAESRAELQLSAALDQRDAVSGVSLEEEALDLIRFREAYSAATRVVSTANDMLDELMSILR